MMGTRPQRRLVQMLRETGINASRIPTAGQGSTILIGDIEGKVISRRKFLTSLFKIIDTDVIFIEKDGEYVVAMKLEKFIDLLKEAGYEEGYHGDYRI